MVKFQEVLRLIQFTDLIESQKVAVWALKIQIRELICENSQESIMVRWEIWIFMLVFTSVTDVLG